MFDRDLVLNILQQISQAMDKISKRSENIKSASEFLDTEEGNEKLDAICMMLIAVGESVKNLDKITDGSLFTDHSEIDWKGIKGMWDIISHHYFDIDAEQVFWVCQNQIEPLKTAISKMSANL